MEIFWNFWWIPVLLFVLWYAFRFGTKDVRFYQYEGGVTQIIRRTHIGFLRWRYRVYSAYTFGNIGEAAIKQRFYTFRAAHQWVLSKRGNNKLRILRRLGDYKFAVARDGSITPIPSDVWDRGTILAKDVLPGTELELTAQGFFKYWKGKNAINKNRLVAA